MEKGKKLKNKMSFSLENTKKGSILSKEDEKHYRINYICRVCDYEIICNKVRDHRLLKGKNKELAHNKTKFVVAQKQSNFLPFTIQNFSVYDCHLFFEKLVEKKKDKVKFRILPNTVEEYTTVIYGC